MFILPLLFLLTISSSFPSGPFGCFAYCDKRLHTILPLSKQTAICTATKSIYLPYGFSFGLLQVNWGWEVG
jgi:hypothetical protein